MPAAPSILLPTLPRFRERAVYLSLPGPVLNMLHQRLYMQRAFAGAGIQALRIVPGHGRMLGLSRSFPSIGGSAGVAAPRLPYYDPRRRFALSGATLNRLMDAIRRTTPLAGFGLGFVQTPMGRMMSLAPWARPSLGHNAAGAAMAGLPFEPPYDPRRSFVMSGAALNRLAADIRAGTPLAGLGLSAKDTPQGRVLKLDHRVLETINFPPGPHPPRNPGDDPDPPGSSDDGSDIIIIIDPPDDPDPPPVSDGSSSSGSDELFI